MSTARSYSVKTPASLKPFGGNPAYKANMSKAMHKGLPVCQTSCCVLCGKKALSQKLFVLLSTDNVYVTQAELSDDDLGEYPVGSDCAKTLKAAGIPVFSR